MINPAEIASIRSTVIQVFFSGVLSGFVLGGVSGVLLCKLPAPRFLRYLVVRGYRRNHVSRQ